MLKVFQELFKVLIWCGVFVFLGGLALAQVLFFYVKYLVLYGVPSLLLRMDGLKPPALPRCVSLMHSFTKMWRLVIIAFLKKILLIYDSKCIKMYMCVFTVTYMPAHL